MFDFFRTLRFSLLHRRLLDSFVLIFIRVFMYTVEKDEDCRKLFKLDLVNVFYETSN